MKGPAAFSFWVALVFFPAADLAEDPRWPEAAALAAVTACYLLSVRAAFGRPAAAPAARVALAGLAGVVLAGCTAYGGTWLYLCPLVSIACVLVLRGRAVPAALSAVTAASMAVAFATGGGQDAAGAVAWGTAAAGVAVHVTLELYRTRRELAEAAVGAERERFSRDLHDLLGHTLSLMVVKAEAVRRLAPRDPSSAARQAAEIEEIGRRALTEVRAAVSGYRGRGLAGELAAAGAALREAGVRATVTADEVRLAPHTDALLGWAVREGVTNVIRHAGAAACRIGVRAGEEEVVLEIENDGSGGRGERGHGLNGLAERAAAAGALLEAGPVGGGGFRLRVAVPVAGEDAAGRPGRTA
ncbi:histidine kinase [Planomonospora venezuelensis]|uniref:Two-component system sensor histidine kinase DesK n=1 Tax=Planomonospora venezuelensis TaxID=1999 RepID=A0A841D3W6_PLAVE|nr:two-component system sensor histidine kinase DesK [Planomonospora venezuelensis]